VPLEPEAVLEGVLVDAQGLPVEGAAVSASGDRSAKTGPDGRFALGCLPEGEHVVVARRDCREIAAAVARARAGSTTDLGTFVARPRRTIRGRVVDEARRPVGGACVTFACVLRSGRDGFLTGGTEPTYTHADGAYAFEVPGLDGFLLVEKAGQGTTPVPLDQAREIILARPAFVRVEATSADLRWTCSVRWPDLVPEAEWEVGYYLPHTVAVAPGRVTIIGNGRPAGCDGPVLARRTRTIEVAPGETAEVTFDR
jgi:hypothetical protein